MKEEKENQKKKEEKINLKEAKEKKVSKKAVKTKDEATDNKEVKKVAKKTPAKKTKTKVKEESDSTAVNLNDEVVENVNAKKKTAKKSTKKVTSKTTKEKNATVKKVDDKETSKATEVNNAKLDESIAKLTNKNIDEIKEEIQNAVKNNEDNTTDNSVSIKDEENTISINNDIEDKEEIIINEPEEKSDKQKRKEKIVEESEQIEKQKKRRSSIIMSSVIAALILIIVIVVIIIGNLNSTTTENHDFYQWYSGQKVEYKGQLTFTRKEGLTELKATDRKVTLDSTPVYYADENDKVIFPEDMAIVYPNNNGMMYRINHFADIIEENGSIYLETNLATKTNKTKLEKAFLYDGQDLYFFLERTTITVNGTNYEVSPLSYAIVRYKQNVEIYNYEKDEYQVIDTTETQEAKVVTDTYTINMSVDSLQTAEKDQLLIRGLSYLQEFGTTEETQE
jgi:translation initiation factor IF-2